MLLNEKSKVVTNVLISFLLSNFRNGWAYLLSQILDGIYADIITPANVTNANTMTNVLSVCSNTKHIAYGYIATNMTAQELGDMHDAAVPPRFFTRTTNAQNYIGINNPLPDPAAVEDLYTVRKLLSLDHDPTCTNPTGFKCKMPTKSIVPDIVLNIEEDPFMNLVNTMEVNGVIIDIVGSKDVWGRDEVSWKGALAATNALNFMERSYLLLVHTSSLDLMQFTRNATNKRIDVTKQTFEIDGISSRRQNQNESTEFIRMMRALAEAVLDVAVGQHPQITASLATMNADGFVPFQNSNTLASRRRQHLNIPFATGCNWIQDRNNISVKATDVHFEGPYAKRLD